jgi:uncharacterized membrane protein YvbJ
MALIDCGECGNQVSSMAATCPKCGNPIAARAETIAAGTQVTTTQQTAKKFKQSMLIGGALCCLGVVLMVSDNLKPHGLVTFMAGLIWYLVARARAWWNNG